MGPTPKPTHLRAEPSWPLVGPLVVMLESAGRVFLLAASGELALQLYRVTVENVYTFSFWGSLGRTVVTAGLAAVARKYVPLLTDRLGKGRADLTPDSLVAHLKAQQAEGVAGPVFDQDAPAVPGQAKIGEIRPDGQVQRPNPSRPTNYSGFPPPPNPDPDLPMRPAQRKRRG